MKVPTAQPCDPAFSISNSTAKFASFVLALALAYVAPHTGRAAEGGLTNYLAGYYGDYAVAVTPKPGFYGYSTVYSYRANTAGPKIPENISVDGLLNISGFQYVTQQTLLGARVGFGAYTTWINAGLTVAAPINLNADAQGHGDSSVSPLVLYWSTGNLHVSLYEAVIVPTGQYYVTHPVNVSRNYYSFDTVLAMTWLDQKQGLEVSIVPGIMANTENSATNYRTGTEFHLDGMLNKYLNPELAVGLHGYFYTQIADDSGAGAATPNLRSSSSAIGPSFLFVPSRLGIEGKIVGKWLHEFHSENRFSGDILSLTAAIRF